MSKHKDFSYTDAASELRKLLIQLLYIRKKSFKKISYKGPEIESNTVLISDRNIQDSFEKSNLKREKEQGRDVIDVFINKVYQLGLSVGHEMEYEKHKVTLAALNDLLKAKLRERGEDPDKVGKIDLSSIDGLLKKARKKHGK